jgi:diketogulonate reductase-like aldo/keto reductase
MQTRPFGRSGEALPVIGQGTWHMEHDDRDAVIDALRRGVDAGATHIDTAEMYGDGAVEEIVGEAIDGIRDRVFLASKVLPQNASRTGTIEACERSLRRLGTDHLDLYLLHWAGRHPLEDTIAAFEELVGAGKIRHYGVSNFDADEIEAAVHLAGPGKIACNQVLYHLEERAIEHRVIDACELRQVAVVAYSPFGSGAFPDSEILDQIAEARRVSARHIALAFLTRRRSIFAIPKSGDPDHAVANAAAGDLVLNEREIALLDEAFPLGAAPAELPSL